MMRLIIDRGPSTDAGTFGTATLGKTSWYSLELPWRENEANFSCIPAGVWIAWAKPSARFGKIVYHLQNVTGRNSVEIHGANWAGDLKKGLHSDLEGCLALGEARGVLTPPTPPYLPAAQPQEAIERSWAAVDALMLLTDSADIEIEIRWTAGNEPGSFDPAVVA